MAKKIHILLFMVPFVVSTFNLQVFVTQLVSHNLAQLIAYGMMGFLILGMILLIKKTGPFSTTARLWIPFYLAYYCFAILANAIHGTQAAILKSIIPTIYFFGFFVFLSVPEYRKVFRKVALFSFVTSSILCIYLFNINFSIDEGGIYMYKIDRAGGVFGDANNAALVAIVAFIFMFKDYKSPTVLKKIFKVVILLVMLYTLFITFSTTGFFVFSITFLILNYKFFNPRQFLLILVLAPMFYLTMINLDTLTSGMNLTEHQKFKINNVVNLLTFNTDKVDNSGREDLVEHLLEYVYQNPFIGNGVDFAIGMRGHNTIIGVWADAGIFTLLIYLTMLFVYFRNTMTTPKDTRFFVLPILMVLCIFMLSLQSVINQPYLMALFVYLGYLIDEKNNQDKFLNQYKPRVI